MNQVNLKNKWHVHKFGGSSLSDAECFLRVANLLHSQDGDRQIVVASAMGGMTNALEALVDSAEKNDKSLTKKVCLIQERYIAAVAQLIDQPEKKQSLLDLFHTDLTDLQDILNAVSLVGTAAKRSHDIILSFGELWSTRLLSSLLEQMIMKDDLNRSVRWIDARELIVVRHGELGPNILWDESNKRLSSFFKEISDGFVVIPGFIASDDQGLHTTLGRNGSYFSASIIGALVDSEDVTIWTDVSGVMSADPYRVPEAAVIGSLTYSEAMELAYFGAKVIHPQTMSPAVMNNIPIYIKNTFQPTDLGSKISEFSNPDSSIKGITTVEDVALINVEGAGMIGVPGTADRLFGALRDAGISVILISQASSEHSICFAVPGLMASKADSIVKKAFNIELKQNQIQKVEVRPECSIIAVVGDGMAGMPGIASRFFSTLANAGINVRAIAQGSSERNISAVIDSNVATRALRAAHAGFYLSAETISVGLIGPGNVGATLLEQMAPQTSNLKANFNLDFRVRGIAASTKMLLAERYIDLNSWQSLIESDWQELDMDLFVRHINADHLPHAVLVDCTASDEVSRNYIDWFDQGIHVVTANKKAQSGSLDYYDAVKYGRRANNSHFLYESSVGAGLPIIQTLRDLNETGDEIISIEGIFSGTLAYLFNVFDGSKPFSTIVKDARDAGYTEPDPRDDLSGVDVARKLIILARELGLRLELSDIHVENLVPDELRDVSIQEFLDALPNFDFEMSERYQKARDQSCVLRYTGSLDKKGRAQVKLQSLPADHSFAHINLTDNIVRFATGRYSDNPLVVQGPGAGPGVTAAGVFSDLLRLARYLGARG